VKPISREFGGLRQKRKSEKNMQQPCSRISFADFGELEKERNGREIVSWFSA
jgi:hypothetical protein